MLSARRGFLALLDGAAAYLPLPQADSNEVVRLRTSLGVGRSIDDDAALVVATSGTTGTPKGALHTAATVNASIEATHTALGGPGVWLSALPTHHIAGLQVLLRSIAAGFDPVALDLTYGFDPRTLAAAVDTLDAPRRYTSLVPGQLRKALGVPAAVAALASFDAILVGGAATPPSLIQAAEAAGLTLVTTYGMSETAGGCVYNGQALPGTQIRIEAPDADGVGRVLLGGSTVARGYRNLPDHPAFADPGWFRTDDLGALDGEHLRIVGRADEAISSGGLTVVPQVVEAVVTDLDSVAECAVFGVPDDQLGERLTIAVVPANVEALPTLEEITEIVTAQLDAYAAPRAIVLVGALPTRGPGKIDRSALRSLIS